MSHDHHNHHGHGHSDMATPNDTSSAMMNHNDHSMHSGHDMGSQPVNAAEGGHQNHNMMMHVSNKSNIVFRSV